MLDQHSGDRRAGLEPVADSFSVWADPAAPPSAFAVVRRRAAGSRPEVQQGRGQATPGAAAEVECAELTAVAFTTHEER